MKKNYKCIIPIEYRLIQNMCNTLFLDLNKPHLHYNHLKAGEISLKGTMTSWHQVLIPKTNVLVSQSQKHRSLKKMNKADLILNNRLYSAKLQYLKVNKIF